MKGLEADIYTTALEKQVNLILVDAFAVEGKLTSFESSLRGESYT